MQSALGKLLGWLASGVVLVICAGCASSADTVSQTTTQSPSQLAHSGVAHTPKDTCVAGLEALGDSVSQALRQSGRPQACARVEAVCRWTIGNSAYRTHTTPGSYVDRPPGSCPSAELDAVLQLAAKIRLAGPRGIGICKLLGAQSRANMQAQASVGHVGCGQLAIAPAAAYNLSAATRISQPVSQVLLNSESPGPPNWFGYLEFTSPKALSNPRNPVYAPLIVQIIKLSHGTWAVNQIGYQF
jgi:hypothetical protein